MECQENKTETGSTWFPHGATNDKINKTKFFFVEWKIRTDDDDNDYEILYIVQSKTVYSVLHFFKKKVFNAGHIRWWVGHMPTISSGSFSG